MKFNRIICISLSFLIALPPGTLAWAQSTDSPPPTPAPTPSAWGGCTPACEAYNKKRDDLIKDTCGKKPEIDDKPITTTSNRTFNTYADCAAKLEAEVGGDLAPKCKTMALIDEAANLDMGTFVLYGVATAACLTACANMIVSAGIADAACTAADLTASALDLVGTMKLQKEGEDAKDLLTVAETMGFTQGAVGGAAGLAAGGLTAANRKDLYETAAEKRAREAAEKTAKEEAEKKAQKASKEASDKFIKEAGDEAAKNAGNDIADEAAKTQAKQAARDAAEQAAKEGAEKAGKEAAEKVTEEAAEKAAKRTLSNNMSCVVAAFLALVTASKGTQTWHVLPKLREETCREIEKLQSFGSYVSPTSGTSTTQVVNDNKTEGPKGTGIRVTTNKTSPSTSSNTSDDGDTHVQRAAALIAADPLMKPLANLFNKVANEDKDKLKTFENALKGSRSPAAALNSTFPDLPQGAKDAFTQAQKMAENGQFTLEGNSGAIASSGGGTGASKGAAATIPQLMTFGARLQQAKAGVDTMNFGGAKVKTPVELSGDDIWHSKWNGTIFDLVSARLKFSKPKVEDLEWSTPLNRALVGLPKEGGKK